MGASTAQKQYQEGQCNYGQLRFRGRKDRGGHVLTVVELMSFLMGLYQPTLKIFPQRFRTNLKGSSSWYLLFCKMIFFLFLHVSIYVYVLLYIHILCRNFTLK